MSSVYHLKPDNLVGTTLFPLSALRKLHPEAAAEHEKKYVNRRAVQEMRIPPLDCLWNDAIHLAPIHPQIIFDLWKELKFDRPQKTFSVIRIPSAQLDEARTATFTPCGKKPVTEFSRFRHETYKELEAVPQAQIDDWHDQRAGGWPLFWYSSIQHVVTCAPIDISQCEVFQLG